MPKGVLINAFLFRFFRNAKSIVDTAEILSNDICMGDSFAMPVTVRFGFSDISVWEGNCPICSDFSVPEAGGVTRSIVAMHGG